MGSSIRKRGVVCDEQNFVTSRPAGNSRLWRRYHVVSRSNSGENQAAERILHKMLRMPPTVPVPERLPRKFLAMLNASAPGPLSMGLPGMRPCVAQKVSLDVGSAVFLIICVDLNACGPVQTELLQSVFGLTRGEAQLARALSTGASLSEIAARTGVGNGALRGQLKSIFLKTDTNRKPNSPLFLASWGALASTGFRCIKIVGDKRRNGVWTQCRIRSSGIWRAYWLSASAPRAELRLRTAVSSWSRLSCFGRRPIL